MKLLKMVSIVFLFVGILPCYSDGVPKLPMEKFYGSSALAYGIPLKLGYAYRLAPQTYLHVIRVVSSGMVIHINTGGFPSVEDTFFLYTRNLLSVGSILPISTCGVYNGKMYNGSGEKPIAVFHEIPCGEYFYSKKITVPVKVRLQPLVTDPSRPLDPVIDSNSSENQETPVPLQPFPGYEKYGKAPEEDNQ